MLKQIATATSRIMQSIIPSSPRMGPSSATWPSMAPWADYWYRSAGLPNISGVMGGDEAHEFVSTCYAATRLLCGIGSKMPLNRTIRSKAANGNVSSTVMSYDKVHKLINFSANPDQTSMTFRSIMVSNQVNRGTAFAEIEREVFTGTPIRLWPIHPSRCLPARSEEDGSLVWTVRNNNGQDVIVRDVDMLRIPYTVTARCGLRGVGVADRATQTILLGQSLDRTENDATMSGVPRIVVETPKMMNLPEQDAFRRQWSELYKQGGEGVALLVGGAVAKPLSWSATDTDHVRRREFNIEDIARWYDVPLTLLRRAVKESAGNIEQLGQEFQTYSLAFLEIWEQELGRKLLTEEERDAGQCWELDYRSLLKADHTGRASYYSSLVPIGAVSPNQVRASEGWNPYPEGDRYFVQGALRPIDEPYSSAKPQNSPVDPKTGKSDPLKVDSTAIQINTEAFKVGACMMLEDCIRRLTHKETCAALRASKKPNEWISWVESFYADHELLAISELKMPIEVCSMFAPRLEHRQFAIDFVSSSKSQLIAIADGPRDTFLTRVETMMESWKNHRASSVVASILELSTPQASTGTSIKTPDYVESQAARGLAWHAEGKSGDGVTDKTIREAQDMANGSVSEDKVRRMGPWFERHQSDMSAPKNKPSNEDFPGAGAVAWALWGGPTSGDIMLAAKWAQGEAARLDRLEKNKNA